jgi:hypothetical protein
MAETSPTVDGCPHCQTGFLVPERLTDFGGSWTGPLQYEVQVYKCVMCARRWEIGRAVYGSQVGKLKDGRAVGARHDKVGA